MTENLKLKAESPEDLQIISAIAQDAIIRVSDITFNKSAATLTIALNRFKHELKAGDRGERVKSGLRFNNVLALQSVGIDRSDPDAFMVLLSIDFMPSKPKPTGEVTLVFSGGGQIRAEAEMLEARLVDYSPARETNSVPLHPLNS